MGFTDYLRTTCQRKDRTDGDGAKEVLVGRLQGKGTFLKRVCWYEDNNKCRVY